MAPYEFLHFPGAFPHFPFYYAVSFGYFIRRHPRPRTSPAAGVPDTISARRAAQLRCARYGRQGGWSTIPATASLGSEALTH
jgi:hypothetical protein